MWDAALPLGFIYVSTVSIKPASEFMSVEKQSVKAGTLVYTVSSLVQCG